MQKFYVNDSGDYLGSFDNGLTPEKEAEIIAAIENAEGNENGQIPTLPLNPFGESAIEVETAPEHFAQKYNFNTESWGNIPVEVLLDDVRARRDSLLKDSDWTQLADSPLTQGEKDEWSAYRQALRDLPETQDIDSIVWPVPPGA